MNAKISMLLAATLAAIAPLAGAANVAAGAAVTTTGPGFGNSEGWCCGAMAAASTVTDGMTLATGTQWNSGTVFWGGDAKDTADTITITLPGAASVSSLFLQGDNNDTYSVSYLGLDNAWHSLAAIDPNSDSGWGLGDNTATFGAVTATAFEIQAAGDGAYAVSEFQANGTFLPAVPEPGMGLMFLAGIGALVSIARRQAR